MKKAILTLVILMAFGVGMKGQRVAGTPLHSQVIPAPGPKVTAVDTLRPESIESMGCGSLILVYPSPNYGYLSGNNEYEDLAKAQKYLIPGTSTAVTDLLIWFGSKTQFNAGTTFNASINSVAGNGMPGGVIQTSNNITIGSVDTTTLTLITLPQPAAVSDSFFVNVNLPDQSGGDLIGIMTTGTPCTAGDLFFEKWSDGAWHSIQEPAGWGIEIDALMYAVVDPQAIGIDEYVQVRGLRLYGAYPYPARDRARVRFELDQRSEISLDLLDATGKWIKSISFGNLGQGRHDLPVSLENHPSGQYFFILKSETGSLAGKILKN